VRVVCIDCGVEEQRSGQELVAPEYRPETHELVAPAFRCVKCAYAAQEAATKRQSKRGLALIGAGALLFAISVIMWWTKSDIEDPGWRDGEGFGSLFLYVFMASIACVAIGLSMIRIRLRKLKE